MASPLDSHWAVVKRILRYLKGTLSRGLLLQSAPIVKPWLFLLSVMLIGHQMWMIGVPLQY